jgi:hypothetical protein
MNLNAQLFTPLKKYISTFSWIFAFLETGIGLLFGGLLGAQLTGARYEKDLWVCGIVYILLLIIKFSTQRLFPVAVVEELQSKAALDDTLKQLARRDVTSEFVANSITATQLADLRNHFRA